MIVSDKVCTYTRKEDVNGKFRIIKIESSIPFSSSDYNSDNYYGLDQDTLHAVIMTDKVTVNHFLKSNPHPESKLDVIRCAEACLKLIAYSQLDRREFFNWLLTQIGPEEVKLGLTT